MLSAHNPRQESNVSAKPELGLTRYDEGRAAFARMLDAWLKASGLPLMTWCRVAEAALGASKLHPSQLSQLRNGLVANLSLLPFDALAAVNEARCLIEDGRRSRVTGALREALLEIPPLRYGQEPASFADLACVYIGLQEPPEVPGWHVAPKLTASEISDALGRVIRRVINERGIDLLDGLSELLRGYPSKDVARLNMLRMVAFGMAQYDESQAEDEVVAVCQALNAMTGEEWTLLRILQELERPLPASL
jgi:hypothetical protein